MGKITELICGNAATPGAGAAGALALALAAACAGKAVTISLKHSDEPELHQARHRFQELCRCALREADEDSEAFVVWVRHVDVETTEELIKSEEEMARLVTALLVTIREVEPLIQSNMRGDMIAAKALAHAAKTIQTANEAETKGGRHTLD